jgi:hypothetical protein
MTFMLIFKNCGLTKAPINDKLGNHLGSTMSKIVCDAAQRGRSSSRGAFVYQLLRLGGSKDERVIQDSSGH